MKNTAVNKNIYIIDANLSLYLTGLPVLKYKNTMDGCLSYSVALLNILLAIYYDMAYVTLVYFVILI